MHGACTAVNKHQRAKHLVKRPVPVRIGDDLPGDARLAPARAAMADGTPEQPSVQAGSSSEADAGSPDAEPAAKQYGGTRRRQKDAQPKVPVVTSSFTLLEPDPAREALKNKPPRPTQFSKT